MSQEQTHALYRFFDAGGDLLYVGITNDPGRRWGRHAKDKPWWHEVDHIEIERYPDRESVLAAEQKAIKEERPRYNVVHKPVELSPTIVEDRPAAGVCACGATAEVLYVLYRDIAEHESEMIAWNRKQSDRAALSGMTLKFLTATDLMSMPDSIRWTASCSEHVPVEGGPYELPYPQSWREWTAHTAHLLGKNWLPETDWSAVLYRAGCADGENLTERNDR